MKKISTNYKLSFFLFVLYTSTYLIDYFTNKSISLIPFVMCVGSLIVFFIFLRKLDTIYYVGILIFSGLALYFGTMLKLYSIIPIYDLILHFASGILLVFLGHYVYDLLIARHKNSSIPMVITISYCTLLSIASAAVWEIWEFTGDVLFGLTSQGSNISDTMTDITAGSIGAVIGGFMLWIILNHKSKKNL